MWEMMPIGWDTEEQQVFHVDCAQPYARYRIPDNEYDTQVAKNRAAVHSSVMAAMSTILQTIGERLLRLRDWREGIRCAHEPALSDNNSHISLPQPTPVSRSKV